jgi:DMSO/TMAO reductase YedYZ heme-binding membrane subunit
MRRLPTGWGQSGALLRSTGDWTLRFLCIVLAVTPLRQFSGWNLLVRYRRMLGLYVLLRLSAPALLCLVRHGLDWGDILADIPKRPFILVGFSTWLLLLVLAATSPKFMLRALGGKRWQWLHRAVYVAVPLALLHFFWMRAGKNNLPRWPSMQPFSAACLAGECCAHSEAINRLQRRADVPDARSGRSRLRATGKRAGRTGRFRIAGLRAS